MDMDRKDAEQALAEIRAARGRVDRAYSYADAAPFFILWGLVWLVANIVTDLRPAMSDAAWLTGVGVGAAATLWITIVQSRARADRWRQAGRDPGATGARIGMTMGAIMAFLVAFLFIVGPLDARQANAAISLFWAFVYLTAGLWLGWRLAVIGALTAAAILFGYFALDRHYFLWMGLAAGGGLIAGGLWLRKI